MSTHTTPPGTSAGVRDLARAMRAGLELRLFRAPKSDEPLPAPPDVRPLLAPLAGLNACPASARPGRLGRVLSLTRRVLRRLMNPWLDQQTRFNQTTIVALETALRVVHTQLTQTLEHCVNTSAVVQEHHAQLDQVIRMLEDRAGWRQELVRGAVTLPGQSQAPAVVTAGVLEDVFLQTHLPPPPAGVLDLGNGSADLAALGYRVERPDSVTAPLPIGNGTLDAVVCLTGAEPADDLPLDEAARVLKPDGRLLLSVAFGPARDIASVGALRERLWKFRLLELAFAVQTDGDWSYSTDELHAERLGGVALVAGVRQ